MTVLDHPRSSDERCDTIRAMLDRYPEAQAQAKGEGGRGGMFSHAILQWDPNTWTREYQELERCLLELRRRALSRGPMIAKNVTSGQAWWHLSHRYLLATTARKEVHVHVNRKTGHRTPGRLPSNCEVIARPTLLNGRTASALVRTWDSKVDPHVVAAAVQWVSGEFRGEPGVFKEAA